MLVKGYEFGKIIVGDREYRNDVVVGDKVLVESWWRKEGHRVSLEDLEWLKGEVDVVVFGTGAYGRVKVDSDVVKALKERGIDVIIEPTAKAVETFNRLKREGKRVILAAHLTC